MNEIENIETLELVEEREVLGQAFKIYGDFDNPVFLAKDVAEWIDYSFKDARRISRDVSKMVAMVDEEEKQKNKLNLGGEDCSHGGIRQNTEMWFLTEDGLYEVLMQSRKPIAKVFKKEVKKILKEIRITGQYGIKNTREIELFNKTNSILAIVEKTMSAYTNMCKINSRKKRSYTDYIKKRLSISKMNFEYEQVKARVFLVLDIEKWEDIAVEQGNILDLIDESIRIIKSERPYQQMSYFR